MARRPMRPRSVKVDDELWDASLEAAEILRTDVSTEIRAALRALVKRAARVKKPTPCDCSDHAAAMAMYQKNMARRDVGIARWDPARVLAEIKAKPPLPLPAIDTEETQP
jgi:hypothetical protein